VSRSDDARARLDALASLLGEEERKAFWKGVIAALHEADGLDEGHTIDLLTALEGEHGSGTEECASCDGLGGFSRYGKPSMQFSRKCLDCRGTGRVVRS
jgi:hypothetical protein